MKRKIAILLSAMMVTTAMPLTANAAQLTSSGVNNTTFGKADSTIDADASKYLEYTTSDQLRGRKSVLKVDLKDDGTDVIPAGTAFTVEIENGTFTDDVDAANKDLANSKYQYVNTTGKGGTLLKAADFKDVSVTNLKTAYEKLTKPAEKAKEDLIGKVITSTQDSALISAIQAVAGGSTQTTKANILANTAVQEALKPYLNQKVDLAHIPYEMSFVSPTQIEIRTLFPISNSDKTLKIDGVAETVADLTIELFTDTSGNTAFADNGNASSIQSVKITRNKQVEIADSYVAVPLGAVKADGNGAVKVKVSAPYSTKVNGGSYDATKGAAEGSTSLVYPESSIKNFDQGTNLDAVIVRENVRGTIANGKDKVKVTLRLNGGFKFTNNFTSSNGGVTVSNDADKSTSITIDSVETSSANSSVTFTISGLGTDRKNPIGLRFDGLKVEPTNEKNFGDVELTVSGDGIDTATKTVAKRAELGFKLETLKDPKEIVSGRYFETYKGSKVESVTGLNEDNNKTVKVKFSEATPGSLLKGRNLDFNLPEGVKITNVKIADQKNITGLAAEDFEVRNNGTTLRLNRNRYDLPSNQTSPASFTMEFTLSVDPSVQGDIKLTATGGGQQNSVETVIAKAVLPFSITTSKTDANLGYQNYSTANIVITETKPGMFLEGQDVNVSLSAPYGTSELGFSSAQYEVSGGEATVNQKTFKVKDGAINFTIDKASYKNPTTITIKDVKVGTTRSVPFGAYDLRIGGNAIINNYTNHKDFDDSNAYVLGTTESSEIKKASRFMQDDISTYNFAGYVNIVTGTGTFDEVVKVTVGEKTILLGDKAIDMDVAPYIQASSNSTMVPLRFVSVALGVDTNNASNPDLSSKIVWDQNTKTTTIYYGAGTGQKIIQFQAGSNIMVVDGTRIPMEYGVKAEIKDGRMFVPFRALGQALGVTVDWDANTRTAIYNQNGGRNTSPVVETTTKATETTTAKGSETTTVKGSETTTTKESTTETTTAAKESSTETTTAKQ